MDNGVNYLRNLGDEISKNVVFSVNIFISKVNYIRQCYRSYIVRQSRLREI